MADHPTSPSARFRLADTPSAITAAADVLAAGRGPVAIDTERASGYRYDDRAFLLQIRRAGAGTILIDPEGHRDHLSQVLSPVLNPLEWIVHAAPSDLPALLMLGLKPTSLFDTELAGRLAGFDKVNLASMVSEVLGHELGASHSAEDWSQRPLPADWLRYASQDVDYLLELAEVMVEILDNQGKLDIAEQEFSYIVDSHRELPAAPTWRDVKGVGSLRQPRQLAVARHLVQVRDAMAQSRDLAVTRILPTRVLVELARSTPTRAHAVISTQGYPRRLHKQAAHWAHEVKQALATDPATWPERNRRSSAAPSKATWSTHYPDSHELLASVREAIAELSEQTAIPPENVLKPAVLREAMWELAEEKSIHTIDGVADFLAAHDARPWQIEATAPLLWAHRGT